jgi:hypothetical protein
MPFGKGELTTALMEWLGKAHETLRTAPYREKIQKCCRTSGLLRPWDRSFQAEAVQREAELFSGIPRERRGLDDDVPGTTEDDDPNACSAGILDDEDDDDLDFSTNEGLAARDEAYIHALILMQSPLGILHVRARHRPPQP